MTYTLALAQCNYPENGDVVSLAADFAQQAAAAGADLLIFPEAFQVGPCADKDAWLTAAEPVGGPFCQAMNKIAAEHGLWMVYTLAEKNLCEGTCPAGSSAATAEPAPAPEPAPESSPAGTAPATGTAEPAPAALPFNTAVVVDPQGAIQGSYRKIHLFDSANTCESSRMTAGNAVFTPIQTPFCTLGLGICYDVRFPELTRAMAVAGANLVVFPAAWEGGPLKIQQWQTLLTARALENEIFVAGACATDGNCIGYSTIAGPDGQVIAAAGDTPQLLTATIDPAAMDAMRQRIPVWNHRRTDLY